ncbi:hypothetical protein CN540_31270 [Bacillus toyonensis]|nr:hypothetical protein CN540_31270 [Bacillus toyonensis]
MSLYYRPRSVIGQGSSVTRIVVGTTLISPRIRSWRISEDITNCDMKIYDDTGIQITWPSSDVKFYVHIAGTY